MMPLSGMLAGGGWLQNLPVIVLVLCIALLAIAFCIGFKKGFRKVQWFGTVWFCASILYFIIDRAATKSNALSVAIKNLGLGEGLTTFLPGFIIALACIVVVLAVYGVLALLLRPRIKFVKKKGDRFDKDETGIEYDPEETDYDDYEKYNSTKMMVRFGYGKPSVLSRLLGATVCMINVACVLYLVIAACVYLIMALGWDQTLLASAFTMPWVAVMKKWVHLYALDFLLIGAVLKLGCVGYSKGFVESLRLLFVKLGVWVAIGVSFWIPFSAMAQTKGSLLYAYVSRCMDAAKLVGAGAYFAPFIGRIISAVLLCAVSLVVIWLLNKAFEKLADAIDNVKFFRVTDGAFSCVIYVLIGMLACFVGWSLLYVISEAGIYNFGARMADGSLSKGLFNVCRDILKPALKALVNMIKGFTL